ncbi:uncharacterized protein LOC129766053 [Toxorhynchites rutilus septentrionalis]|uniref:uncharacterized protein LOC129766053 n=1 Tax=Toxorhynchites rutilus septentrionalis TaxID=329112 RepID=UPI00247A9223|nr:uncharacterized protein LOC129766053 [Toxorhynchites rutilus septentrionalis]
MNIFSIIGVIYIVHNFYANCKPGFEQTSALFPDGKSTSGMDDGSYNGYDNPEYSFNAPAEQGKISGMSAFSDEEVSLALDRLTLRELNQLSRLIDNEEKADRIPSKRNVTSPRIHNYNKREEVREKKRTGIEVIKSWFSRTSPTKSTRRPTVESTTTTSTVGTTSSTKTTKHVPIKTNFPSYGPGHLGVQSRVNHSKPAMRNTQVTVKLLNESNAISKHSMRSVPYNNHQSDDHIRRPLSRRERKRRMSGGHSYKSEEVSLVTGTSGTLEDSFPDPTSSAEARSPLESLVRVKRE